MDKTKVRVGEMERRTLQTTDFEVTGGADAPKIGGYAAVFNSTTLIRSFWGDFYERVAPGAFTNALVTSDVRALFNHDPNLVLGRMKAGTLTLVEDEKGLRYEVTPPNAQWAQDLLETLRRGDVDQSSFGFTVKFDRWDEINGMDVRTILEIECLYDVSPVTYPAYEETEAGLRSFEEYRKRKEDPTIRLTLLQRQLELLQVD
jgi:HK97 family phage prohead protease